MLRISQTESPQKQIFYAIAYRTMLNHPTFDVITDKKVTSFSFIAICDIFNTTNDYYGSAVRALLPRSIVERYTSDRARGDCMIPSPDTIRRQ